ncbi:MAG: N-acetylmuramoyl-L-alanine amidase [Candidatus Dactylopiibacterium carminicum]|uniref:N-acetylmuramoyl-L-alanine amidase n=1 Tax=Candidatus Dactylopiibacterium carminicum TaxID=857335 RepID=A0A272EXH8_9RHOO|nr:N-acetylmuramoyl-L-alanine amidase [Candidatus Dactylopiibacterium carminicum]KAF7600158.1 N-acetylmuramoyl-L-alanine amidase [Candidatus Dactylopiibacterium carminicum]PAS94822.1 MAG: N-acetylmuramoyl-L-alanine amidase [Candidatus Dactylopiibacterium carminicum]PAS97746.1 MAG: N-acetylmuramoyl-L-alanine amidase [Candidatus Dactylopiibacterium carminicum]PAT00162.1 MAG: N-acetylmuramoyl-L-alanine amidase [Candidatus Dactylopiibacterium carminicum]
MARPINLILIHCAATPNGKSLFRGKAGEPGFQTPAEAIDGWHAQRGFRRDPAALPRLNPSLRSIGYHFLIYTNGQIVTGRHTDEIGAHCQGYNQRSLGICLIGTDKFTRAQWESLAYLQTSLAGKYPNAAWKGHRDMSPDQNRNGIVEPFEWLKVCPGFDVSAWLAGGKRPLANHLYEEVAP